MAGEQARKLATGAAALAGIWILTYWLWPSAPSDEAPPITFDEWSPIEERPEIERRPDAEPAPIEIEPEFVDLAPEVAGGPRVAAPEFEDHVVKPGESMQSIARARYGDALLWRAIAQANPRVDPVRLRAGRTIRIPADPANVQGLPIDPETNEPTPREAPDAPAPIEYTVAEGDTLSHIAKRFYGSGARWRMIFEANRMTLRAPEDLRPGMKLMIPPPPEHASVIDENG